MTFLETLVPSNCFSSATVWASCGVGRDELVFCGCTPISDMNCQTRQTGQEGISTILLKGLPPVRCWSDPAISEAKLVTYKVEDLFEIQP